MSTSLYDPSIVKWSMNGGVSKGEGQNSEKNSSASYYHISLVVMCAAMRGLLLMQCGWSLLSRSCIVPEFRIGGWAHGKENTTDHKDLPTSAFFM